MSKFKCSSGGYTKLEQLDGKWYILMTKDGWKEKYLDQPDSSILLIYNYF